MEQIIELDITSYSTNGMSQKYRVEYDEEITGLYALAEDENGHELAIDVTLLMLNADFKELVEETLQEELSGL